MDVNFIASITRQSKALIILVIITMCLVITSGSPSQITRGKHQEVRRLHRHQRHSVRSDQDVLRTDLTKPPWWHKPCGSNNIPHIRKRHVHDNKASLTILKDAIVHARTNYEEKETKLLEKMYSSDIDIKKKLKDPKGYFEWLPKNQIRDFRNKTRGWSKKRIINRKLPQLHISLQKFGLTFDNLETVNLNVQISSFDPEERVEIILKAKSEIRKVLCELETYLKSADIDIPEDIVRKFNESNKGWNQKPDHTNLTNLDVHVFSSYGRFIIDWTEIIQYIIGMDETGRLPVENEEYIKHYHSNRNTNDIDVFSDRHHHIMEKYHTNQNENKAKNLTPRNHRRQLYLKRKNGEKKKRRSYPTSSDILTYLRSYYRQQRDKKVEAL